MSKIVQIRLKNLESATQLISAATITLSKSRHAFKLLNFNIAGAQAVTLPAATGKGGFYHVYYSVTATGNKTIKTAGTDILNGIAAVQTTLFQTASNSNTITFNGTTTGGVAGSSLILRDAAPGNWEVEINAEGTSSAATPFSNT